MDNPTFQILIVPEQGGPDELIFVDGTLRESRAEASIASEFPVGRGRVTTDHIQAQPTRFTADLYISETPLRTLQRELVTDYSISEVVRNYGGQDARVIGPNRRLTAFERGRALFNRLNDLRKEGRLMTLTTAMGQLADMAIIRLDVPHEGATSATVITVEWQQVVIADSEETRDVEVPRLNRAQDAGQQTGTEEPEVAETEDVVPPRSGLAALRDFAGF